MLIHLSIHHLAVVEHLELSFESGMTVLTGETGAGKSILIDALGLTLGERAESTLVRPGCPFAEVSALYDIHHLPNVIQWLTEHQLDVATELGPIASTPCMIRRTMTADGRSRAYVNGRLVPINQLKELSEYLVNIHGQHQHQTLLKSEYQRALLDEYGQHAELCTAVRFAHHNLQQLYQERTELLHLQGQHDKLALLQYQVEELVEFNYQPNECQQLEEEYRHLAHAADWQSLVTTVCTMLQSEEAGGALETLHRAANTILSLKRETTAIESCHALLTQAIIHIEEALEELTHFRDTLTLDPERFAWVDQRLSHIHALARKHRIAPQAILDHQKALQQAAQQLSDMQTASSEILEKIQQAETHYQQVAQQLSLARQHAASHLSELMMAHIQALEMPNARFEVQLTQKTEPFTPSIHGLDDVEFLLSTNPGLPLQPLRKIASGGELSRLSLAIQVATAQKMITPTLIFDEVDAGISGKTAEVVGDLLRRLSRTVQVLCITHLPQVASKGQHHYKVEKQQDIEHATTTTSIRPLTKPDKIQEIARLLGGIKITHNALAHAEEMLDNHTL